MRLVLDTNIVVAAMRSRTGASAEIIRLALRRKLTLLGTLALALEYREVCARPKGRSPLSEADAIRFAEEVSALMEPVNVHFGWRPLSADPEDDKVLEAALNGRADALVTFNLRDFVIPARRFGLPVVGPSAILRSLENDA